MELQSLTKVKDGRYIKNYELTYLNKAGHIKRYEIISHKELVSPADLGQNPSGVSIVALWEGKLLLLHEFRMGVNRSIYNLCAGMIEKEETIEECIARELLEETGLQVQRIRKILPPSFSAVSISDITTYIALVDVTGIPKGMGSENEQIDASFYTKEEVTQLLDRKEPFSSRAQFAAYCFSIGAFDSFQSD